MPKAVTTTSPPFAGFGPRALDFFRALAFHQDKAWFEENRGLYESDVRQPLETLLLALTAEFERGKIPLRGDAKSIFRLHRDVRFAKDKRPYKTNGGAVLTRTGSKKSPGLLYLHVEPDGCFMAAGFHRPEADELAALRRRIVREADAFRAVLAGLGRTGLGLGEMDNLARLPRGFETVTEPDLATAVRKRSLVVRRPLPDAALARPDLVATLATFGKEAAPLLRFGWDALGP